MSSDSAARAQALDPERSFIVQAPAGSGKTELLTQRYLRLLARVARPEQILAITFTRKAAAEMRSRILRALESAALDPPESAHKRATWELARAVRDADAARAWGLMQHPARLRIQTIDALNAYLARRLPVLSSSGGALEPTEDARPLYETAGRRLIERLGDQHDEMHGLAALIGHLGNRAERLVELLSDLLARRDQWLHQVVSARTLEDLRGALEATLRSLIEHELESLHERLGAQSEELAALARFAAANLIGADGSRDARLLACANFDGPLTHSTECLPVWRMIADILLTKDGDVLKQVSKRHGFPPTHPLMKAKLQQALDEVREDEALIDALRALRTLPEPTYTAEQWRIVEALLEVLPLAVSELQLVFQQEGKGDYVEAALRALQALGGSGEPSDLALAVDERLQHILVDEFQDTSFTQLDLLERLTEGWTSGDGRTLFCVGDPMQSIYRFRQAEVGLFLQLQSRGLTNVRLTPLTLSSNFRSTQPIVEWVNRVFPAVFAPRNDAELGAVQYSPSVAAIDDRSGGVHIHPALTDDASAEAREIVTLVQATLQRDAASTVAVLVSARAHVAVLAREFANAQVDYQAVEIELLQERPVVQDLIALTRALVHLADRTAWLAVLRAPWCGLSLADLHALVADDREQTIRALLDQRFNAAIHRVSPDATNARRRRRSISQQQLAFDLPELSASQLEWSPAGLQRAARTFAVLEAALAHRGRWPLREWVERTWNALGGPATLSDPGDLDDAEAFFSRLDAIETASDLEDVADLERRLDRLFAQPRVRGPARVEVMTIHKAKGLEFETVILPALHRGARGEQRDLLRWARVVGPHSGMLLAPVKADGAPPDPLYAWIEALEKERAQHERARLLYVAATRCKRDLHLFGASEVKLEDGEETFVAPRSGTLLAMLWREVLPAFQAALNRSPEPTPRAMHDTIEASLRRLPLEWRAPEPDASAPLEVMRAPVDLQRPEFNWVSEISRHVGTVVHRELERMTAMQSFPLEQSLSMSLPRLTAELAELGVPLDRCREGGKRVINAIERTLGDPKGQWLLGMRGDLREAQSELALSGVLDGEVVSGVIDRTFVDETGVRWIVDFKTSTHEGGGVDSFLDEELMRYSPQLARYARLIKLLSPEQTVRAALYFPLLQAWREAPMV